MSSEVVGSDMAEANDDPTPQPKSGGLLGNASALLAGRLLVAAMGWGGTVLIVRALDEEQFGQFAFVFGLLGMLSIVSDMGMGRVAIRGVLDPDRNRAEFAGSYVVLRTMLGFVAYGLSMVFVLVANYPDVVVKATAIAGLVVLLATPSHAYQIAFQAHLQMGKVAVAGVLGQAAQLALTVALVTAGGTLLWFVVPAVLAEVVILAFTVPTARRLMPFHYVLKPDIWAEIAREAIPLSIGGALVTLYDEVDTVMLSKLDTFASVGSYGVAYKFADLARFVATAFTLPLLTIMVRSWSTDLEFFRAALRRGFALLGLLGGAAIVQSVLFAEPIVELLYGPAYRSAGNVTRLLIIATVLGFFTRLAINVLIAADHQRSYPWVAAAGLAFNVGLNFVLIPIASFEGAAIATIATEAAVLAALTISMRRIPSLMPIGLGFFWRGAIPIAAGFAAGASAESAMPWPVAAFLALAAYVATAQLVRSTGPGGLRALLHEGPLS